MNDGKAGPPPHLKRDCGSGKKSGPGASLATGERTGGVGGIRDYNLLFFRGTPAGADGEKKSLGGGGGTVNIRGVELRAGEGKCGE